MHPSWSCAMFILAIAALMQLPGWVAAVDPDDRLRLLDVSDAPEDIVANLGPVQQGNKANSSESGVLAKRDLLLGSRALTCPYEGYGLCPGQSFCCPLDQGCCQGGGCAEPTGDCCGNGYSCSTGWFCCGSGGECAEVGGECCRGGGYCRPGDRCVIYNGVRGCCPNGNCDGYGSVDIDYYSYSFYYYYSTRWTEYDHTTRTYVETLTSTKMISKTTEVSTSTLESTSTTSSSSSSTTPTPTSIQAAAGGAGCDEDGSTSIDRAASSTYLIKTDCSCPAVNQQERSSSVRQTSRTGDTCTIFIAGPSATTTATTTTAAAATRTSSATNGASSSSSSSPSETATPPRPGGPGQSASQASSLAKGVLSITTMVVWSFALLALAVVL